jgi:ankyrin repeat protein
MNTSDIYPLLPEDTVELFTDQAKQFVKSFKAGDAEAVKRIKRYYQLIDQRHREIKPVLLDHFTVSGAKKIIAREYGFNSWNELVKYMEEMTVEDSVVAQFELAADTIINGDIKALRSLLEKNPALVYQRSMRVHQSTLLHYISANGLENYRQKSPNNAVEILRLLLDAGAEVDAVQADGGSTALGLVATSIHPKEAGVQIPLLEMLLDAGADVDGILFTWNPLNAALANGRGEAAEYLASRGAMLDLEGACGVGRLDAVKLFFDNKGDLKNIATKEQLFAGFCWACEYNRINIVQWLLEKDLDDGAIFEGFHWAAFGGYIDIVNLILPLLPDLEKRNRWGTTVLGAAVYGAGNKASHDHVAVIKTLLALGADMDADEGLRNNVNKILGTAASN